MSGNHPSRIAKRKKSSLKNRLRDFWDIKHINIHIMGIPEGKQGEKEQKMYFKK